MITISISGLPGSGTTTVAKILASHLQYNYVNTGMIFRQMAAEKNMPLNEFGKYVASHPEIDRELDQRQITIALQEKIVLEGRLSGYMLSASNIPAFKVWLEAAIEVRASRVARREKQPLIQAKSEMLERENGEKERYIAVYGFDIDRRDCYDLVIDSGQFQPEEIAHQIIANVPKTPSSDY